MGTQCTVELLLVLACLLHQWSQVRDLVSCPLPCRNPACSSAISVSVFTRILSSVIRRTILLAWETRLVVLYFAHCSRSPFLGSGMNVENIHSSGHSPVSQTHILCILSSTVSPPALNSSAGTSSRPVALRLAVCRMARATSERSGGGSCSQYSCSIPFPSLSWYKSYTLSTCLRFVHLQSIYRQSLTGHIADVAGTFESLI